MSVFLTFLSENCYVHFIFDTGSVVYRSVPYQSVEKVKNKLSIIIPTLFAMHFCRCVIVVSCIHLS